MKKEFLPSLILSILCLVFFSGIYSLVLYGIAQLAPGKGEGCTGEANGKKYYSNIAQKFTDDQYFWSRPSAVDYNAAGSAGTNKGPSNPDYLATVQERIDSFLAHHPDVKKEEIPSEMVTCSGSGLDPDISPEGAAIQVDRVARARNISAQKLKELIRQQTKQPLLGLFGPQKINVVQLNLALDNLK